MSLEQILALDPEVIVTQDPDFASQALTDPSWRSIAAVRTRRVHLAPSLPFGWLDGPPGVNRLIGVRWLSERLHPGRMGGETALQAAVVDFFRLFYGVAADAALIGKPA